MFQVELTTSGQSLSGLVTLDGIILSSTYIADISSVSSVPSSGVVLDTDACGNIKNSIGNVFIKDFSSENYHACTILFYYMSGNTKTVVAGYSQENPFVRKGNDLLNVCIPFDFSAFTNGFIFALIQAGSPTAAHNSDGIIHIEDPNTVSDDSYSVYSKSQIDSLLDGKQSTLSAGNGIAISSNTIKTTGIPFGICDDTSTSTAFTVTVPGIYKLEDGVCCMVKNGVVTSAAGFTLDVNSLGGKPCYTNMAAATADTTVFNVNYTMLFVYDSTRVDGGCWICYRGYYQSDTDKIGYQLRTNSTLMTVSDRARYYKIYFTSADNTQWVPATSNWVNDATTVKTVNQRPINPFGRIVYTSATTNYTAGSNLAAATIWDQYVVTLGYSFNTTGAALTLSEKVPVYVKCSPQSNGSAIIDSTTPIVQSLPSSNDGKIYILLGVATNATAVELIINHPVYYHDGSGIKLWTGTIVPTKVSQLTNDSGYITSYTETDPTVPSWAKESTKPSYTLDEVSDGTTRVLPTVNDATLTIQRNSTTVDTFSANASSNVTVNISVPTDTGDLTNNAGFLTSADLSNYVTTNTSQTISGEKTFSASSVNISDDTILSFTYSDSTSASVNVSSRDEIATSGGNVEVPDLNIDLGAHTNYTNISDDDDAYHQLHIGYTNSEIAYFGDSGLRMASGKNVYANSFVKSGGTSSQFLKADGSVDSSTYIPSSSAGSFVTTNTTQTITGEKTFDSSSVNIAHGTDLSFEYEDANDVITFAEIHSSERTELDTSGDSAYIPDLVINLDNTDYIDLPISSNIGLTKSKLSVVRGNSEIAYIGNDFLYAASIGSSSHKIPYIYATNIGDKYNRATSIYATTFYGTLDGSATSAESSTYASYLSNAKSIDGVTFSNSSNIVHYGECTVAAATQIKDVTIPNFNLNLVTGSKVIVKFTYTNSASNPQLRVNTSGTNGTAKPIMYRGTDPVATGSYYRWQPGSVIEFIYNGTNWVWVGFQEYVYYSSLANNAYYLYNSSVGAIASGYYSNPTRAIIPYNSNATSDLGTSSSKWRTLYLSTSISNGTYTYSLPSATGTLALTSDIPQDVFLVATSGTSLSIDSENDYRDPVPASDPESGNPRWAGNEVSLEVDQYVDLTANLRLSVYVPAQMFIGSIAFPTDSEISDYAAYPIYFRGTESIHNPVVPEGSVLRLTFRQNAFYNDFYDIADFGVEHEPIVRVGKAPHQSYDSSYNGALVALRRDNNKFDKLLTISRSGVTTTTTLLDMADGSPIYASFLGECFAAHPHVPFGMFLNMEYIYSAGQTPSASNVAFDFITSDSSTIADHIVTKTSGDVNHPYRYFQVDNASVFLLLTTSTGHRISIGGIPTGCEGKLIGFLAAGTDNAGLLRLVNCCNNPASQSSGGSTEYYGVCSTAANQAAKVVTIPSYTVTNPVATGTRVIVKFSNNNTASSPTLKVSSDGTNGIAAYILYRSNSSNKVSNSSNYYRWMANDIVEFIFDGTYWVWVGFREHVKYAGSADRADFSDFAYSLIDGGESVTIYGGTYSSNAVFFTEADFLPSSNASFDLGKSDRKWSSVYTGAVNFGSANSAASTTYTASLQLYNSDTTNYKNGISCTGNLLPSSTNTYNLGSPSLKWGTIYANQIGDSNNTVTVYGSMSSATTAEGLKKTVSSTDYTFSLNANNCWQPTTAIEVTSQVGPYVYCQTAANVQKKEVTISNFQFRAGSRILVKFQYSNSASSPTLCIHNTISDTGTTYYIRNYNSSPVGTTNYLSWLAGQIVELVFDGSHWYRQGFQYYAYSADTASSATSATHAGKLASGNGNEDYLLYDSSSYNLISKKSIVPDISEEYDLGASNINWKTLYVNTIYADGGIYGDVFGNITPALTNTYDIGDSSRKYRKAYFSGGSSSHYIVIDTSQSSEPTIRPDTDNCGYLGSSSYKWCGIYTRNINIYLLAISIQVPTSASVYTLNRGDTVTSSSSYVKYIADAGLHIYRTYYSALGGYENGAYANGSYDSTTNISGTFRLLGKISCTNDNAYRTFIVPALQVV